jgi:RNA recognition motif-containing protein
MITLAFETKKGEVQSYDEQEWAGGPHSAAHEKDEYGSDELAREDADNSGWSQRRPRPCEMFVCNLPHKCNVYELLELFRPYGTILSYFALDFEVSVTS